MSERQYTYPNFYRWVHQHIDLTENVTDYLTERLILNLEEDIEDEEKLTIEVGEITIYLSLYYLNSLKGYNPTLKTSLGKIKRIVKYSGETFILTNEVFRKHPDWFVQITVEEIKLALDSLQKSGAITYRELDKPLKELRSDYLVQVYRDIDNILERLYNSRALSYAEAKKSLKEYFYSESLNHQRIAEALESLEKQEKLTLEEAQKLLDDLQDQGVLSFSELDRSMLGYLADKNTFTYLNIIQMLEDFENIRVLVSEEIQKVLEEFNQPEKFKYKNLSRRIRRLEEHGATAYKKDKNDLEIKLTPITAPRDYYEGSN